MFMIIILLINCYPFTLLGGESKEIVTLAFALLVLVLTIASGIDYFVKNISVFKEKEEE